MAYPGTIAAGDQVNLPGDPASMQRNGPFEYNGNLYAAIPNNDLGLGVTANSIDMHKSTDGGQTWAVMDALNGPAIRGNSDPTTEGPFLNGVMDVQPSSDGVHSEV